MNLIKRTFKSSSGNGEYVAAIDTDTGAASCQCRGWIFKRAGKERECKHTRSLLAEFGFSKGGVLPVKAAQKAKSAPGAAAPVPKVSAEAFAKAQAAVENALALVKGKRTIEFDEEEADPAVAAVPPKAQAPLSAADVKAILCFAPPLVKPMLASALKEDQSLSDFTGPEWVLEEKFDGHRLMLVVKEGALAGWSRPGVDRAAAMRALPPQLVADALNLPDGTYDGELFVPGGTSSDVTRLDKADDLRLVLFDVIEVMGVSAIERPLGQRRALLELCVAHTPYGGRVFIAEQGPVSLDAVKAIWENKGEGAIVKRVDSLYRSGYRTPNWVKIKKIDAAEMTITGFEEGKNGPYSVALIRHDDGRETKVKVLTQDLLRDIEKNPTRYVGRRLVISYMGKTANGGFRHPIWDHVLWEAAA